MPNPHENLNNKILTTWNHRNGNRFAIPEEFERAIEAMLHSGNFPNQGNPDRPFTSNVVPIIINAREGNTFEVDNEDWRILEDWIYQYQPIDRSNFIGDETMGAKFQNYKINKLFNIMDIDQWRAHLPPHYIEEIDSDGKPTKFTIRTQDAMDLYIKSVELDGDNNFLGYTYTTQESEKLAIEDFPTDLNVESNEKTIRTNRSETYNIFIRFKKNERNHNNLDGIEFGSHLSNINYSKFGYVKCWGNNLIQILIANEKEELMRLGGLTEELGIGGRYSEIRINNEGDNMPEHIKVKTLKSSLHNKGTNVEKYLRLRSSQELDEDSKIYSTMDGKKYKKVFHNGEVYYSQIFKETDLEFV